MDDLSLYYDPERWRVQQWDGTWRDRTIQAPVALVLGHYERLTAQQLHDHASDIQAEINRRG